MLSFFEGWIQYDKIIFGLCIFVWYIILLPILFYYLYHYNENKSDPFIRPRNPQLALVSNYFIVMIIMIIGTIQWAEIIYCESYKYGKIGEYIMIIRITWEQLSIWLKLIRYWHLWYKYNYQKICGLSVYIKAIDNNAMKRNFFLNKHRTLGNLNFLVFMTLIIWCIAIVFFIFILLISEHKYSYNIITSIIFSFYLFQCICFILLSVTINKTRDSLYIGNEIFYESIFVLCSCLILFIMLYNNNIINNKYFISLIMFIYPWIYFISLYGTCIWIYSKMKQKHKEISHIPSHSVTSTNLSVSTITSTKSSNKSLSNKPSHLLNKLLQNKIGFELFVQFLIKEFSVENILFLLEVESYRNNCKAKYGKKLCMEKNMVKNCVIPQSADFKAFENNLKLQFCVLYHKYIDHNSDLSVNVASRNRLVCQLLYNELYEISHEEILNDYDYDYDDDCDLVHTHKRFSSSIKFTDKNKNNNKKNNNKQLKIEISNIDNHKLSPYKYNQNKTTITITPTPTIINMEHSFETMELNEETLHLNNKKPITPLSLSPQISNIKEECSNNKSSNNSSNEWSIHCVQKRASTSLLNLNRLPRNILNQRIDEMMLLMNNKQKNYKYSNEILNKYIDNIDHIQSIIDALENCLKDIIANLKDSFARFVFTDDYKRWSGDQ